MSLTAPLLTAEAAKILDVTPVTVRRLERAGKLTATRTVSGVRIFERAEVERLASQRGPRHPYGDTE